MMIISQGAEAIIKMEGDVLVKHRIPKSYRDENIDDNLAAFVMTLVS